MNRSIHSTLHLTPDRLFNRTPSRFLSMTTTRFPCDGRVQYLEEGEECVVVKRVMFRATIVIHPEFATTTNLPRQRHDALSGTYQVGVQYLLVRVLQRGMKHIMHKRQLSRQNYQDIA